MRILNQFATNSPALSESGTIRGSLRHVTDHLCLQMKAAERRLKLALEAKDMDEIQAALRDLTRLQHRQAA